MGRPPGRPRCPDWLTDEQREEFNFVCRLLEEQNLLFHCDQSDVLSLGLARDQLRIAEETLTNEGRFLTERVLGAWVKCPICHGESARPSGPKCKTCRSKGAIQKQGRKVVSRHPAARDAKEARDAILKFSAALGLDPTSRTRLLGKPEQPKRTSALRELLSTRGNR